MKVFILGGTGLLGEACAKMLIENGHIVGSIALTPPKPENKIEKMHLTIGNLYNYSDNEIKNLMRGYDSFIFAAGVDERVEFPAPVYESYYKYNIEPLKRIIPLLKDVGLEQIVVMGSYFTHFEEKWPKLKLYEHHPYIRSRVDQKNLALSFADENFKVSVLELPYIFGVQKGRMPVWEIYVKLLSKMKKIIYFPKGGTTMVTVKQVAQTVYGALTKAKVSKAYPVGWYNKTWKEFLTIANKAMENPNKKIVSVPTFTVNIAGKFLNKSYAKKGIEPGLNPAKFGKLQSAFTYITPQIIRDELGVTSDDINTEITKSFAYANQIYNEKLQVTEMKAE